MRPWLLTPAVKFAERPPIIAPSVVVTLLTFTASSFAGDQIGAE